MKAEKIGKYILAFFVCCFCACSQDEPENPGIIPGYEYESVSTKDIAKALAHLCPDMEVCEEVHKAARCAVDFGLEESYYFIEALGSEEKITKTSAIRRSLKSKLETLPTGNSIKELFARISKDEEFLRNYQIYWPYSENWNKQEFPTITFQSQPINLSEAENVGYRYENGQIEEVTVNEEYARLHPVWIVNFNPVPYDEYPDFSTQNWVHYSIKLFGDYQVYKDRIIYYPKPFDAETKPSTMRPDYVENPYLLDFQDEDQQFGLYLRNVKFKEKDSELNGFFAGSSHYVISMDVMDNNDYTIEKLNKIFNNYPEMTEKMEVVSVRFVFLRSKMQLGHVQILDAVLTWKWAVFYQSSPLAIIQEFGGEPTTVGEKSDVPIYFSYVHEFDEIDGGAWICLKPELIFCRSNDLILNRGNLSRYPSYIHDKHKAGNLTYTLAVTSGQATPPWTYPSN